MDDRLLRELVILEAGLEQAQAALEAMGHLLHVDVRAGSVSAMKASLRAKSAKTKGLDPAQPALPF